MKNINDALLKIKKNPKKYISKKSINYLDLFITGYILSQRDETGEYPESLLGFQEFVEQKYKISSNIRYSKIIRIYSTSDEDAFEKFYDILDEFYKNKLGAIE